VPRLLLKRSSPNSEDADVPEGRYKKLFEMDFMKKAAEQRRERAREHAQNVLREIRELEEDEEADDDNDDDAAEDRAKNDGEQNGTKATTGKITKESLAQAAQEVKSLFRSGESGGDAKNSTGFLLGRRKQKIFTTTTTTAATAEADEDVNPFRYAEQEEEEEEENPWLQPAAASSSAAAGSRSNGRVGRSSSRKETNASAGRRGTTNNDSQVIINTLAMNSMNSNKNTLQTPSLADDDDAKVNDNMKKSKNKNKNKNKKKENQAQQQQSQEEEKKELGASNSTATTGNRSSTASNDRKAPLKLSLSEGDQAHSQADLVQMAFAGPDLEAEFHAYKTREIDEELGLGAKKMKVLSDVKAGWGDWAGPGAGGMQISQRTLNKRDKLLTKIQSEHASKVMHRSDAKQAGVMISQRRIKTAAKFKISEIPHPFTTVEEYERSLQMPLGDEWNSSDVVKRNTQPEVKTRAGRIIEPVKLAKKRSAPALAASNAKTSSASKKPRK